MMVDEPNDLIRVLQEIARRANCDKRFAALGGIEQSECQHLVDESIRIVGKGKIHGVDVMTAVAQGATQTVEEHSVAAANERDRGRRNEDAH
jgi:hypothetical protein